MFQNLLISKEPNVIPHLPTILMEVGEQLAFVEALLAYAQAGEAVSQFGALVDKLPATFTYQRWSYLVDKDALLFLVDRL